MSTALLDEQLKAVLLAWAMQLYYAASSALHLAAVLPTLLGFFNPWTGAA